MPSPSLRLGEGARELRAAAAACEGELRACAEQRGALEEELDDRRSRALAAGGDLAAQLRSLEELLAKAAEGVRKLTRQQLEEVRSLDRPPPLVRRALGLVHCCLNPQNAERLGSLDELDWGRHLVRMLKQGDLLRRLERFPPEGETHPLIAYPKVAGLILAHVSPAEADGAEPDADAAEQGQTPTGRSARRAKTLPGQASKTYGLIFSITLRFFNQ